MTAIQTFYENLYSSEIDHSSNGFYDFGRDLQFAKLSDEEKINRDGEITVEECETILQYRSKVSWHSLEPRSSSLETRYSILDSFEYRVSSLEDRVSSIELWVEKVNELVAWLISREINCTNGLPVLRTIVPLSLAITKMSATDSIVNTDKGTRVFSCDVYANEWMNLPPK